jgi:hypothetical protein
MCDPSLTVAYSAGATCTLTTITESDMQPGTNPVSVSGDLSRCLLRQLHWHYRLCNAAVYSAARKAVLSRVQRLRTLLVHDNSIVCYSRINVSGGGAEAGERWRR